jgi:hypothetical protein
MRFTPSPTKKHQATSPIKFSPSPRKSLNRALKNHAFLPTTQKIILIKKMNILVQGLFEGMGEDEAVRILPELNGVTHELIMLQRNKDEKVTTWPSHGGGHYITDT